MPTGCTTIYIYLGDNKKNELPPLQIKVSLLCNVPGRNCLTRTKQCELVLKINTDTLKKESQKGQVKYILATFFSLGIHDILGKKLNPKGYWIKTSVCGTPGNIVCWVHKNTL